MMDPRGLSSFFAILSVISLTSLPTVHLLADAVTLVRNAWCVTPPGRTTAFQQPCCSGQSKFRNDYRCSALRGP